MSGRGAAGEQDHDDHERDPLPISASDSRSEPVAAPATAIIKMAEVADWLTNSAPCSKKPPPTASAATSASSTATAIATALERPGGELATALTAVPTPIAITTPTISCRAHWPQSSVPLDSDTAPPRRGRRTAGGGRAGYARYTRP